MNRKSKTGLSLIEVLLALGVITIVLYALGGGFNQTMQGNVDIRNQLAAIEDAKKILEQVRLTADQGGISAVTDTQYWAGWLEEGKNWGIANSALFSPLPGAIRSLEFPDGTSGNPLHVRATITWQEKNQTRAYSLDTFVTKRT